MLKTLAKGQAVNPYLPSYEYIPDGEPRVFGDRVYVYGSHDRFNAPIFCVNDYVCYSAAIDDLSDWRYEGVIFRKNQDPRNRLGIRLLFAPDVVQGPDGRFYLYYAYDFLGMIGVAVCDSPAGSYEFYGHVHYPDGVAWGRKKGDQFPFDPGVLVDDDKSVYLYSGFATVTPAIASDFHKLKHDGGVVVELEQDMLTIKKEPKLLFPKEGPGSYQDHEFFEASSIRKYKDKYYFVYSSRHNHELCYATSNYPDRDFAFKGTLISQGDLFLEHDGAINTDESKATNYLGNTHGGLLRLGDEWYIFYHRQTNQHSYSRQACAEQLKVKENGDFQQAEVTSCGLNHGPLSGIGRYESYIACNLWSKEGTGRYDGKAVKKKLKGHPYFTQEGKDREENPNQYIKNMQDGSVAGFKYFDLTETKEVSIEIKGNGIGYFEVSDNADFKESYKVKVSVASEQLSQEFMQNIENFTGVSALYFRYVGSGQVDFLAFTLS